MYSPLEQFELVVLVPLWFSFVDTTISSYVVSLLLNSIAILVIWVQVLKNARVIPNTLQTFIESLYNLVVSIVLQQAGIIGLRYLPLIFYLFIMIWGVNVFGMVPYSLTATSHLMFTLSLGLSVCIGILILGFMLKGIKFLYLFIPSNIPSVLLPFIVLVEIVSYCIRPISLSMRLFANIMAGHTLLFILGAFTVTLFDLNLIFVLSSFILMMAIMLLEFGIAFLQAYVFVVLVSVYLNDSL